MFLKFLLVFAILVQLVASAYALRLIPKTRYNAIWILFILGFFLLSVERILQYLWVSGEGAHIGMTVWIGVVVSIALSISMVYAHKLVNHVDRMERHRQLVNRRILTAVLRAEERSRSRFAKELHDGLGPLLSSAKMSLSAVLRSESDQSRRAIIENTAYMIEETIRSVREISNNMSPHILSDFGLAHAIRTFVEKCASMHKVKIEFDTNLREERFDGDVEVILYRVVCELVNNSLKHSGCQEIELSLKHIDEELEVLYSDDGCGFEPAIMMDCGMGLSNISSRVQSLNGEFQLGRGERCGMTAKVKISLKKGGQSEPFRRL